MFSLDTLYFFMCSCVIVAYLPFSLGHNFSDFYEIFTLLRKYRFAIGFAFTIAALYFANRPVGTEAFDISVSNTIEMLSLLPPVFILVGLLDVWVPKETIIQYMGENSGWKGILMALFLGSAAAGPLYVAFPVTALLLRKRARLAYVLFFLGVWSTTKLPIVLYEISYGIKVHSNPCSCWGPPFPVVFHDNRKGDARRN